MALEATGLCVSFVKYAVIVLRMIGAILILSGGIMLFFETRYYKEQLVPENGRFDAAYNGYILLLSGYCCLVAGRLVQLSLRITTITDNTYKCEAEDQIESEGSLRSGWFFFTLIETLLDLTLCVFFGFMVFRYVIDDAKVRDLCDAQADKTECEKCQNKLEYQQSYAQLSVIEIDNNNPMVKFRNQYITMFTLTIILGTVYVTKAFLQIFFLTYMNAITNPVQFVFPFPISSKTPFRQIIIPFRNHMVVSSILFGAAFMTLAVDLSGGNMRFIPDDIDTIAPGGLFSALSPDCANYEQQPRYQAGEALSNKTLISPVLQLPGFFEKDLTKTFFIAHTLVMTACILLFISEASFFALRLFYFMKPHEQHHLAQGSWEYSTDCPENKEAKTMLPLNPSRAAKL